MSKILIVEDDLSIQALLHDFIQEAGHSVVLAADGVEVLTRYSEQVFDLVMLDVMLPKIDGYGVCEVIRQKSDVPIIMLTALDGEENQIRGLDLQADDYNHKAFFHACPASENSRCPAPFIKTWVCAADYEL